jgi:glycosyltransferase involved in cell wall biosynthesis
LESFVVAPGQIAIIGTVGLPARYGGFETLAEQIVRAAARRGLSQRLTVWCSMPQTAAPRPAEVWGARLRYLPLRANGAQSIPYDALSLVQAAQSGHSAALVLGVSGAMALPLMRGLSGMRIISHLDGLEWQRPKWGRLARAVLERSEAMAARWSHEIVADNPEIAAHIRTRYAREPIEIAYGHEAPDTPQPADISDLKLPPSYALAIARAEPENNLALMLDAFGTGGGQLPLVAVANWSGTDHGRALKARHAHHPHLHLIEAEYDQARLNAIQQGARVYVHGHSAGGTNPILVRMMGAGLAIAAWDCGFNRATTEGAAAYFDSAESLRALIAPLAGPEHGPRMAADLRAIAERRYRWEDVTDAYFQLLGL